MPEARLRFVPGERIRIDAATQIWGRVVGPATVVESADPRSGRVMVSADSIHARILVRRDECSPEEEGNDA